VRLLGNQLLAAAIAPQRHPQAPAVSETDRFRRARCQIDTTKSSAAAPSACSQPLDAFPGFARVFTWSFTISVCICPTRRLLLDLSVPANWSATAFSLS